MSKLRTEPPIVTSATLATLTPPVTLFTFGTQSTLKVDCCLLLRPSRLFRYNSPLLIPAGVSLMLRIFCSAPQPNHSNLLKSLPGHLPSPSLSDPCWSAFSPLGSPSAPFTLTGWHRQARHRDSVSAKGTLGDGEEESAGTAVDVRFALTGTGCVGRPVILVSVKGRWAGAKGDVGGIKGWCWGVKGWGEVE